MATEILLCSENFIRAASNISDNVAGKFILPSLREAQDIKYRTIVGDALLAKLKELVRDSEVNLPENALYKECLDRSKYFLCYSTIVEVCNKVTYKIGNFGVAKSSDENLQPVGADELSRQTFYYQSKADAACFDLQRWLWENKDSIPELTERECGKIKATLFSAASSGIFLGGARGKIVRK